MNSSERGAQLIPESMDFQIPPEGEPMYMIFGSVGSSATQFTLPIPGFHPVGFVQAFGPSGVQLLDLDSEVGNWASNCNRSR